MRAPTETQFRQLEILGSGAMALAPSRGDWGPLLRRGWVAPERDDDPDKRYLPPLRITPEGLRALADGLERYGHQPLGPNDGPQLNESPRVTKLKAKIEELEEEVREIRNQRWRAESAVRQIRRNVVESANAILERA